MEEKLNGRRYMKKTCLTEKKPLVALTEIYLNNLNYCGCVDYSKQNLDIKNEWELQPRFLNVMIQISIFSYFVGRKTIGTDKFDGWKWLI